MRIYTLAAVSMLALCGVARAQLPPSIYTPPGPAIATPDYLAGDVLLIMRGNTAYRTNNISPYLKTMSPAFQNVTASGNATLPITPVTGSAGPNTFFANTDIEMTTTHGTDAQESGLMVNVKSVTGANGSIPTGTNNQKVAGTFDIFADVNSGPTWAVVGDTVVAPGSSTGSGHVSAEFDMNNAAYDSNGSPTMGIITNLWMGGIAAFPNLATIYATGQETTYNAHYWALLNDPKFTKDADIYSITTGTNGFVENGSGRSGCDFCAFDPSGQGFQATGVHASDFSAGGTGAMALNIYNTHTTASVVDSSSSPAYLLATGNHPLGIINSVGDSSGLFAAMKDGQKLCENGQNNCEYHLASGQKKYFTGPTGNIIASLSDTGNLVIAGTLTQNGTP